MKRKEFVKNCGVGCVGFLVFPGILSGCAGTKYVDAKIEGDNLVVPLAAFAIDKPNEIRYRGYIVLQHDSLKYPICVYRLSADSYKALWMRCTHKGTELRVYGTMLQCPAHGSEFNSNGEVQHGPASSNLRTFAVLIADMNLNISLK